MTSRFHNKVSFPIYYSMMGSARDTVIAICLAQILDFYLIEIVFPIALKTNTGCESVTVIPDLHYNIR